MNRRGFIFGTVGLVSAAFSPADGYARIPGYERYDPTFDVRKLESIVFLQVFEGYERQKRPENPHWLRHSHEYLPTNAEQLAFYKSVREHLVEHFEVVGWPAEAPELFVLPPDRYVFDFADVLGGQAFITYRAKDGEEFAWRRGWRDDKWRRTTLSGAPYA